MAEYPRLAQVLFWWMVDPSFIKALKIEDFPARRHFCM